MIKLEFKEIKLVSCTTYIDPSSLEA